MNLHIRHAPMRQLCYAFAALLLGAATAWYAAGQPTSVWEYRFMQRLTDTKGSLGSRLDLQTLMPGDWHSVCGVTSYPEDRSFRSWGSRHGGPVDPTWRLTFRSSDGSTRAVEGSCRTRGVLMKMDACVERSASILLAAAERNACTEFWHIPGLPS